MSRNLKSKSGVAVTLAGSGTLGQSRISDLMRTRRNEAEEPSRYLNGARLMRDEELRWLAGGQKVKKMF